jgi:hypothetical protein
MAAKTIKNKTRRYKDIAAAKQLLTDAAQEGFETVLIIGYRANKVVIRNSSSADMMRKIGMIEAAKLNWFLTCRRK